MSGHAKGHLILAIFLMFLTLGGSVFLFLALMPISTSGTRQLTILVVSAGGGTSSVGIGTSTSQATVHYGDGSSQVVTGSSVTLIPVFKQSSIQLNKVPTTTDWAVQVTYLPKNINLNNYCKSIVNIPLISGPKACPVDAVLIIETDIGIAVNGKVVAESPSNGKYMAATSTGYLDKNVTGWIQPYANLFNQPSLPTFKFGEAAPSFSLPAFDNTPYRDSQTSVTVSLVGTQKFYIYPVYVVPTFGTYYETNMNIACGDSSCTTPYTVNYSDPSYQLPPTTVTAPDFSMSVTPAALNMSTSTANNGNTGFIKVSGLAYNSLTGKFHVDLQNLPTGITFTYYTPNDPEVTTTSTLAGVQLQFLTASTTKTGTYTAMITATLGAISHTNPLIIGISSSANPCPSGAKCIGTPVTLNAEIAQNQISGLFPYTVTGSLNLMYSQTGAAGATIYITTSYGTSTTSVTGADGKFSATLFAPQQQGTYKVTVTFPGDSQYNSAQPVTLALIVLPVNYTLIILIVGAIAVIVIVGVGMSMRKRAGGP